MVCRDHEILLPALEPKRSNKAINRSTLAIRFFRAARFDDTFRLSFEEDLNG